MKRILINKEQERLLNEAMYHNDMLHNLPRHLVNDLNMNQTSVSDINFFTKTYGKDALSKLIIERYNEVIENFSDDISNVTKDDVANKLSKLLKKCSDKERKIRPQLEKICYNTLCKIFDIPKDSFDYECHLIDVIDNNKEFQIYPTPSNKNYASLKDYDFSDLEIQKRRLINSLCVGGAMRISEKARSLYLNEIFELDEELPHLYSRIIKLNELYLFLSSIKLTDKMHQQGGFVEITLSNDYEIAKMNVYAINFPILLDQSIKGCMELFASFGLPSDNETMNDIMDASDALCYEPWDMRIGPALFDNLFKHIDVDTIDLPYIFTELVKIQPEEFSNLFGKVMMNIEDGISELNKISQKALHDKQYSDFEDDIIAKTNDTETLITDDLNEEIDEATYPQSFDMNTFKSLRSFRKRIWYCEQHLMRISSGSARIVYKIDDNTVLKLAKNEKGIAQNEVEGQPDYYRRKIGIFAEVYDVDENYLWIEMQLARKAKVSDFKRITGFPFRLIQDWCMHLSDNITGHRHITNSDKYFESEKFENLLTNDYTIFSQLESYVLNYQITTIGDLQRISSWGVVNTPNGEELVLVDYGLNNDVFERYY